VLLGVDVGGTFTDAVLVGEGSRVHTAKVPSTPGAQERGVLEAVRAVLALAGVTAGDVELFAHGMTVATNALLEGDTARTALIATEGFTDVIELGRQNRPHLYRLCDSAPVPLVPAGLRFAAPERVAPEGVLRPLRREDALALAQRVRATGVQAVAVALLHSYADPRHEQLLGELLGELLPDACVSLSSDLVGTFREFERTATTALDAALSPALSGYLARLRAGARELSLRAPAVMQSSGGLASAERAGEHAALTLLSGPAGGVGGAQLLASLAGERHVVCFDMGGTSCDVCVIDGGEVPETASRTVAGRPLALPALDIHTVGAGGGSIAWRDPGGALRVGPRSAGAEPGPACYGRGGRDPTVTDANVLLGRLPAESPLAGAVALDRAAAEAAVGALARSLGLGLLACAEGIVRVAEAGMLAALRLMTVDRGVDPRGFALMPFGGAGPLHAAALAQELGIERVLCPRASGVLSALGLAAAAPRRDVARTLPAGEQPLTGEAIAAARTDVLDAALAELDGDPARARVRYELRYRGQSHELVVAEDVSDPARPGDAPAAGELALAFARVHERRYGYRDAHAQVELVTVRASAWAHAPQLAPRAEAAASARTRVRAQPTEIHLDGRTVAATLHRGEPAPGSTLAGPALVALAQATLLIPAGWRAAVDEYGTIVMEPTA
jgi:N-methylhydantoinase A